MNSSLKHKLNRVLYASSGIFLRLIFPTLQRSWFPPFFRTPPTRAIYWKTLRSYAVVVIHDPPLRNLRFTIHPTCPLCLGLGVNRYNVHVAFRSCFPNFSSCFRFSHTPFYICHTHSLLSLATNSTSTLSFI